MTKIQILLSLTLFTQTLVPAVAAEKFECPSPFNPTLRPNWRRSKVCFLMSVQWPISASSTSRSMLCGGKACQRPHHRPSYRRLLSDDRSRSFVTDAERAALVRRFSGQVTRLVYSLESGLDIIINVRLTPDIVDAVNSIARKQGLSGPAWIAMTIDNALQQQSAAQRQ